MKKKKSIILLVLVFVVVAIFIVSKQTNKDSDDVSIQNDYYSYINKDILADKELESDKAYWGIFATDTQDTVDSNISDLIKEKVNQEDKGNVAKLYDSVINSENVDNLEEIDKYIRLIDSSKSIGEYVTNVLKVNKELSMGMLVNFTIEDDYVDNTKKIINFYPIAYDYGIQYPDYYTNPLYYSYASTFIKYDREFLQYYGYTEEQAKESVKNIINLYMKISEKAKTMEDLTDYSSYYNIVTLEELQEIYSNIDVISYIKMYGIDRLYNYSIVDIEQAKAINNILIQDNLESLKDYSKLQILQNYAQYGSSKYRKAYQELQAKLSGTEISKDTINEYAEDIVKNYFDTDISKLYINKFVSQKSIDDFKIIIDDILKTYKDKLSNNDWLTNETKEQAIKKLENMTVNIGEPKKWATYSENYQLSDNLLKNIISMNKDITKYTIRANMNDEKYSLMSQLVVNAYYNFKDNSINFPVALLDYSLYNENNTYYQNLGSIGMIIAHEITHAFDNNGALFDEKGNLNNWWTETDKQAFNNLKNDVEEYYNNYKVNGKSISGSKTAGENIADLGAISCITKLAIDKGANKEEMQQLFESFANLWASKSTEEYQKMLLIVDTHSPDKIRVNGVLSSINEFYDLYDIKENDEMYVEPEKRVKIW